MGDFTYAAAEEGKVRTNQIQNTAIGNIVIGEDVASYVRRATALELEKAGAVISSSDGTIIQGRVLRFRADDLGFSVRWSYKVRYEIIRKTTGKQLLAKTYNAQPRTTGKFGMPDDYVPVFNSLIRDGIEQFMADARKGGYLSESGQRE